MAQVQYTNQQPLQAQPVYVQQNQQQPQYYAQPQVQMQQQQQIVYQQPQQAGAVVAAPMPGTPPGSPAVLAMAAPPAPPGCPPGLEYFSVLDHIWVMEKPQLIEIVTGWDANQKWQCMNNGGLQVYWAQENTDCCTRQCCGSYRPFLINCFDPNGRPVIKLTRPYRMNSAWAFGGLPINFCCLQDLEVRDLNNNLIGRVVQRWSIWKPWFDLVDETGAVLLSIEGPCCTSPCFGDIPFQLLGPAPNAANGIRAPIGSITKKWGGILREAFIPNQADNFACVFPIELSVKAKCLVFTSCFLIDFMFFENKRGGSNIHG